MSIFLKLNTHYKETYITEGLGSNINTYFIFLLFWRWGWGIYNNTTYCALVRFLPCVAPHVHHQHVLSLKRFLLPTAFLPSTDEHLLVGLYMIYIYMLQWKINSIQWKVNSQNKNLMKLCTQTIHNTCIRNAKYACICIWKYRYFNILKLYDVLTLLLSEFFFQ